MKLRRFLPRNGARFVGLTTVAVLVVLALFGDWIAPHDPNAQDIARRLEGPSSDYWLGTDHLGRDLLSRLIGGTRIGLTLGVPVIAIALVFGLSIGLASG
jgi:ABC-type dipeptide/oligopeptide/nickel transport system permease subunit